MHLSFPVASEMLKCSFTKLVETYKVTAILE